DEKTQLYKRKTEIFKNLPEVKPMPGALRLLTTMGDMGMKRVLVTGSGQMSLLDRLNRDFPGVFGKENMVTSRDVKNGKPHPEPYIRGMMIAGTTPSTTLVVENAPLGVVAGDRSGAFTVAVMTGPIPREEFEKAGAAVIFESMEQFAEEFPKLMLDLFNTSVD
ncbi:MAG: HAD hydrolase-like protein, partial [Muribaculaceae bacterium]|nr:HAD hydrolase-like protein [Muribaculaceae bacterium]